MLLIFAQLSFFISLSTFVYLHFYNYQHQSACKQNFTNDFLVITFVNLENRLFAIACPFGGENRRILLVYKCLIINKIRFNIHFLISLTMVFMSKVHLLVFLFWADDIQKNDSRCWIDVLWVLFNHYFMFVNIALELNNVSSMLPSFLSTDLLSPKSFVLQSCCLKLYFQYVVVCNILIYSHICALCWYALCLVGMRRNFSSHHSDIK